MSCLFLPLEALDKAGKTLALSIAIGGVDPVGIHGEHALGSIAHPGDDRPDFLWVRFWDSSTIKHARAMEQLPMSLIPCTHAGPFPCDLPNSCEARTTWPHRHRWIQQKSKVEC
jgi:hypothetical protein